GADRCTFCYVRGFELRADRPSDERYGRSIRVKTNVAEVLRRELARPSWRREGIAIGAATDPYQPAEGKYKLTRACLEVLAGAANPFAIITRGPIIVRDLDVLVEAARRADVGVTFSIPTLDLDIWRRTEPGTARPAVRAAVRAARVSEGGDDEPGARAGARARAEARRARPAACAVAAASRGGAAQARGLAGLYRPGDARGSLRLRAQLWSQPDG